MPTPSTSATPASAPLRFHAGLAGALAPFALFLSGVAWLGLSGAPDERGFWPILVAALFVSMLLARDRATWCETVVEGMSRPVVMVMVMAWLLAGVLSSLMGASGFVEALVWLAEVLGVSGAGYVVAAFLICCVVSTSTGTSLGTVILCAPLLYPAAGALGADPVMLMGAILGGGTFGDNVSPVSDTTIASALTQEADMGGVVRSRLRYALPAAAVALLVSALLGGADRPASEEGSPTPAVAPAATAESTQVATNEATPPPPSPRGLPMLAAPALILGLLLRRRHLLEGLLAGIAAATALGLLLGLLEPADLLRIDPDQLAAQGLVVAGLGNGIGVSIFTLLLMGVVAPIERAGVVDRLVKIAEKRTHSLPGAERWTFATISGTVLLTTHSTVAILTAGEFSRRIGRRFGVGRYRTANILDTTACSWPHIFPWFIPAILTASTTVSGASRGLPRLSPVEVGLANVHSWALLGMMLLAVGLGYGREKSPPDGREEAR